MRVGVGACWLLELLYFAAVPQLPCCQLAALSSTGVSESGALRTPGVLGVGGLRCLRQAPGDDVKAAVAVPIDVGADRHRPVLRGRR